MSKVSNEALIDVVQVYNDEGRTAAYDLLRNQYGVKNPYFTRKRIDKDPRFQYVPERDCYLINALTEADHLFMSIEELCSPVVPQRVQTAEKQLIDSRPADMEKLIQELLGDRLLELSRYISLDSLSKTMIIDQTSLKSAGYRVVTH
ncbi:MAG: hypothetical protein Q8N92_00765 [Erysipelotrichaceae bacterium]|nr:hypothetical protein [Erysipelotrichaceae bacterium]